MKRSKSVQQDNFIPVNFAMIKEHGVNNTLFYTFLSDWQEDMLNRCNNRNEEKESFLFALSKKDIAKWTGLSTYQVRACFKYWENKKCIKTLLSGMPCKLYVRFYKGGF